MKCGKDYIGVGVGAVVFNSEGKIFLSKRSGDVRNEPGAWEFPGGAVEFGEKLGDAVRREFREEYGLLIEPVELLCVADHILPDEGQHWVSPTFIAVQVAGEAEIREPRKCTEIGWFDLESLPGPLTTISKNDLEEYTHKYGLRPIDPKRNGHEKKLPK